MYDYSNVNKVPMKISHRSEECIHKTLTIRHKSKWLPIVLRKNFFGTSRCNCLTARFVYLNQRFTCKKNKIISWATRFYVILENQAWDLQTEFMYETKQNWSIVKFSLLNCFPNDLVTFQLTNNCTKKIRRCYVIWNVLPPRRGSPYRWKLLFWLPNQIDPCVFELLFFLNLSWYLYFKKKMIF